MKITSISAQIKNPDRVNISVDGKYRFSLDVYQVVDLGIKIGKDYTEDELVELETESQFGKLYSRALEYCMLRPHSSREVRDYLYRKTLDKRTKTGDIQKGVDVTVTERVFDRLVEKGHVDDERFARWWIENRNLKKGTSQRKLIAELQQKGIDRKIIDASLITSPRDDQDELKKVIDRKRKRYTDDNKLIQYLMRQGFSYDDIKLTMSDSD